MTAPSLGLYLGTSKLNETLIRANSDSLGSGWLAEWQYRKMLNITSAAGAGTNYQIKIEAYYGDLSNVENAANPSIIQGNYLAENIVYDSATERFWWVFEDRTSAPSAIRLASSPSLDGPWTVESGTVIAEPGHNVYAPCIAHFNGYWYIYYGRADNTIWGQNVDIWVQKSSSVNSGYSTTGIANPILSRGTIGSWDANRADEPFVFLENTTYYLFFMGEDVPGGIEKVGYATSSSPTEGWTEYNENPVVQGDHGWDSGQDKAADPFVFKYDGTFWVGVSAVATGKDSTGRTGFYTTEDFVTFTYYSLNPVLGYGVAGSWDSKAAFRGAVSDFNGTLEFSYVGSDGTFFRCGQTVLTFSKTDEGDQVFLHYKCRPDFGDVRFTSSDGTTLLDYWIENEVDANYATFWVKIKDDLSTQNQTICVYYGKDDVTTTSNGNNVFLLFDDFTGDLSKWSIITGAWQVQNGCLTIEPTPDYNYLVSANSVGISGIAIGSKIKSEPDGDTLAHAGLIWHATNQTGTNQENEQVYLRPHEYDHTVWSNIQPGYYSRSILTFHDSTFGSYFAWSTWHEVEVRIPPSGDVKLYGDDSYWADCGAQKYSHDHIGFVAHDSGEDYWDYILVRKYVNSEPSPGNWGNEERDPSTLHYSQMAFDFRDLDNNNVTSMVAWQLYNNSQLLNYAEGQYSLLDGNYMLKTSIDTYLIDTRDLDTTTYGNSTVTVVLQMKQHSSTLGGYIASNGIILSINVENETATNLTYTLSASPGQLMIKVPHNAEYIKKDGVYLNAWTWEYLHKIILLDSSNSTYEFNFLNP